jgi:RND family efflux transporter MFP subunit
MTTVGLIMGLILSTTGCREAPASEAVPSVTPSESIPAVRVRAASVSRESFDRPVALSGVARANRRAMLSADVPGRVVERNAEVGRQVDEGDVLLQLDTRHIRLDIEATQANVAARRTDVSYAEQELDRATTLHEAGAQPGRVRDQAAYNTQKARDGLRIARATEAKATQALRDTKVRAPFAGVVAECLVDEGDTVGPGRPVVTLVDLSQVRVVVGVAAEDAAQLEPGQEATVTFEALGGVALQGRLHHIGPSPDRMSGTYPAEFVVENLDGRLREGLVAHVSLPAQPHDALLIPQSAVLRVGGSPAVFVIEGEGDELAVRRREVRLGSSADGRVEVLQGLDVGERVVTEGLFALSEGSRVEID